MPGSPIRGLRGPLKLWGRFPRILRTLFLLHRKHGSQSLIVVARVLGLTGAGHTMTGTGRRGPVPGRGCQLTALPEPSRCCREVAALARPANMSPPFTAPGAVSSAVAHRRKQRLGGSTWVMGGEGLSLEERGCSTPRHPESGVLSLAVVLTPARWAAPTGSRTEGKPRPDPIPRVCCPGHGHDEKRHQVDSNPGC